MSLHIVMDKVVPRDRKIHFNLEGFDIKRARNNKGAGNDESVTDYEFNLVIDNPKYLTRTIFYRNYEEVSHNKIFEELNK